MSRRVSAVGLSFNLHTNRTLSGCHLAQRLEAGDTSMRQSRRLRIS
jgi:hypothetical protein